MTVFEWSCEECCDDDTMLQATACSASQLDDFMKLDCQDCIGESSSAALAEFGR